MKLRTQIAVIVLIPLIGILITTAIGSQKALRVIVAADHTASVLDDTIIVSDLIHELQIERGLSAGYVSSGGDQFANELIAQRANVDAAHLAFDALMSAAQEFDTDRLEILASGLDALSAFRQGVSSLTATVPEVVSTFTQMIEDARAENAIALTNVDFAEVGSAGAGHAMLAAAKEYAGRQRAIGAVGFGTGEFTQSGRFSFLEMGTAQNLMLEKADTYISRVLPTKKIATLPERQAVKQVEALVKGDPANDRPIELTGDQWFAMSTQAIDAMRQAEVELFDSLSAVVQSEQSAAQIRAAIFLVTATAAFLLSAIALYFFARKLSTKLAQLIDAMRSITAQEADVEVPWQEDRSEIGDVSRTLAVMRDTLEDNAAEIFNKANLIESISSQQATVEFSPDGKVVTANQNFLDVMEYSSDEIIGRPHAILCKKEFVKSIEYREMWEGLKRGELKSGTFERVTKSGETVFLQANYNPVCDASGKLTRVVMMASDITDAENERNANIAEREAMERDLTHVVHSLNRALADMSQGDLTTQIHEEFAAEFDALRNNFNDAIRQLEATMSTVIVNASNIRGETTQVASAADELAQRTENQAAALEETAAALEHLTTSVHSTSEAAGAASEDVKSAEKAALDSGKVVKKAVKAMSRIEKSSEQIVQIIGVIEDIAFQTNLLALNAGVEAARAGDAGRGFAVVASEVQALATRTADAAKEIKVLISTSSKQVGSGVELVGRAGQALEMIAESVTVVTELVTNIASSAKEQSVGIGEINTAVNELDQVTQQNAAMVEEANAASHNMRSEAEGLVAVVSNFKTSDQATEDSAATGKGAAQKDGRLSRDTAARSHGNAALADEPVDLLTDWEAF